MRSIQERVAPLALACLGALGGMAASHAADASASTPAWTAGVVSPARADLAAESGFYLRVEPARVVGDRAGERLTLSTRLGVTRTQAARTIMSVQVEDDQGKVVGPAKVSPRMNLGAATEIKGSEVTLEPLPDGWYRLRAQAVFVDPAEPREALGSETDSIYVQVHHGEIWLVDMTEWFARSNVNLGRSLP